MHERHVERVVTIRRVYKAKQLSTQISTVQKEFDNYRNGAYELSLPVHAKASANA